MQVGVDVKCIHTNFGGCAFSGFGDIATLNFGQIPLLYHKLHMYMYLHFYSNHFLFVF